MSGLAKLKKELTEKSSLSVEQETIRNVITGKIYEIMREDNVTESRLASKLKVSTKFVKLLLSGDKNFDIDLLTEILYVLNRKIHITFNKSYQ